MFKSYLKIAVRNIAKHKYFSIINVFGLALGMSMSLLLISFYLLVSSFDDFHTKRDNIYRVISTLHKGGDREDLASAPAALAQRLPNEFQGIKEIVRINSTFRGDVVSSKLNIPIQGYYADVNFFSMFDFEMIQGNPATALSEPNSIVLTESVARKIVASGDALGQSLEIDGMGIFEVTGIIKDPKRTHFMFEVLIPFSTLPAKVRGEESNPEQWASYWDQYIYVLLDNSLNTEKLQQSLDRIANDVSSQSKEAKVEFKLQALGDITPGPDLENSTGPDTDYNLIIVFTIFCLLILLPACFNYTNISIARALKRSKEIGLRKTMGGVRNQIFFQFITETVTITVISLVGAVIIFMFIRPGFKSMMMEASWLDLQLTWEMLGMFLLFAIVTGFLAGVFPALHFAGLNPIQALGAKSNTKGLSRITMRRALVTFQFALSFCFIVAIIVFGRQYRYNLNFDYGFNTENILDVELQGVDPALFKSEYSRLSSVQDISMSSGITGLSYSSTRVRTQPAGDSIKVFQLFVDANYINNMELTLLAGQNFTNVSEQREQHIIVNEEFLHAWQITTPTDAIGRTFIVEGKEFSVIGVLRNFHFSPVYDPIKPFFLRTNPSRFAYANVKVASPDIHATRTSMEETWRKLNDTRKFEAHFFDDEMEIGYNFYWALLKMIGFLGAMAITISVLGLLGMVVYTTENRIKEIGIRKVLGAQEMTITYLLSKDFIRLMLWAICFAIPASVFLLEGALSGLQYYRVSLNVWDILGGLICFLTIGIATIVSQTLKAARANPVDTLRYE